MDLFQHPSSEGSFPCWKDSQGVWRPRMRRPPHLCCVIGTRISHKPAHPTCSARQNPTAAGGLNIWTNTTQGFYFLFSGEGRNFPSLLPQNSDRFFKCVVLQSSFSELIESRVKKRKKKPALHLEWEKHKNIFRTWLPALQICLYSSNSSGEDEQNKFGIRFSLHFISIEYLWAHGLYKNWDLISPLVSSFSSLSSLWRTKNGSWQGWFHGCGTPAVRCLSSHAQKSPVLGLMLCCHPLEILNDF